MGDNFFNGMFPYIDVDAKGSVAGMIKALDTGLMLAGSGTKIIPGHGGVLDRIDGLLPAAVVLWLILNYYAGSSVLKDELGAALFLL